MFGWLKAIIRKAICRCSPKRCGGNPSSTEPIYFGIISEADVEKVRQHRASGRRHPLLDLIARKGERSWYVAENAARMDVSGVCWVLHKGANPSSGPANPGLSRLREMDSKRLGPNRLWLQGNWGWIFRSWYKGFGEKVHSPAPTEGDKSRPLNSPEQRHRQNQRNLGYLRGRRYGDPNSAGGGKGIRTHDTEGRIWPFQQLSCSEMTGFPP